MHKLVLSFDIHNENGKSILKNDVPNMMEYPITPVDVKQFDIGLAIHRLERFLMHYYCTGFSTLEDSSKIRNTALEVLNYNYELSFPRGALKPRAYHSEVYKKDSKVFGTGLISPYTEYLEKEL